MFGLEKKSERKRKEQEETVRYFLGYLVIKRENEREKIIHFLQLNK